MDGEQLEILKELCASVVPLGVLTVVVLAVILFGISTATESAAIGALGAMYLAVMARYQRQVWWWSLVGAIIFLLGWPLEWTEIIVIFCPIFIPLLSHFQIDPILFGTMVAVNLQAWRCRRSISRVCRRST